MPLKPRNDAWTVKRHAGTRAGRARPIVIVWESLSSSNNRRHSLSRVSSVKGSVRVVFETLKLGLDMLAGVHHGHCPGLRRELRQPALGQRSRPLASRAAIGSQDGHARPHQGASRRSTASSRAALGLSDPADQRNPNRPQSAQPQPLSTRGTHALLTWLPLQG